MKQLTSLFLVAFLCSCASETINVVEEIPWDKNLVNVKGDVKSITYGDDENKYTFVFNKEGQIVEWYKGSSEDLYAAPVIFERDSIGRISTAEYKYIDDGFMYGEEPSVVTETTNFIYDNKGYLTETKIDGASIKYSDYNDNGGPTKMTGSSEYGTITEWESTITYSDNDEKGNWLKTKHSNRDKEGLNDPWEDDLERSISYYSSNDSDYSAEQEKKYNKFVISYFSDFLPDELVKTTKEMDELMTELQNMEPVYKEIKKQQSNQKANQNSNQATNQDLAIFKELEKIDKQIENSKMETSKAFADYQLAIIEYGKTLPAFQYRAPVNDGIYKTEELCRQAIRYVNEIQTIDKTPLLKKYEMQIQACVNFSNELNSLN